MAKGQSPLLGYNTNVRHKGRVFHIQTEDSGVAHPHVITHLFADGGRILKSNKTSYAELLEAPDMQTQVKKIMQDQHKAMFIALRDGQFDHLIDPDATQGTPAYQTGKHAAQPGVSAPPAVRPPSPADASGANAAAPPAGTPARPAAAAPPAAAPPAAPRPASPGATAPTAASPNIVAPGDTGRGSVAPGVAASSLPPSSRSGRYAPVRAPEILGSFKPKPESTSIFGDGLMSEKSLDEVILAYLADDLDDTKR